MCCWGTAHCCSRYGNRVEVPENTRRGTALRRGISTPGYSCRETQNFNVKTHVHPCVHCSAVPKTQDAEAAFVPAIHGDPAEPRPPCPCGLTSQREPAAVLRVGSESVLSKGSRQDAPQREPRPQPRSRAGAPSCSVLAVAEGACWPGHPAALLPVLPEFCQRPH